DVGKPLVGAMKGGLWEVRSNLPSKRIARVLFGVEGGLMVILHGFVKKTAQTPGEDLKLARKRWTDWNKYNA
ncbi:MAG: type II toxin-antitoxin system RelE/ParE family toxin, partial [Alphaproteobacteria bacterium]